MITKKKIFIQIFIYSSVGELFAVKKPDVMPAPAEEVLVFVNIKLFYSMMLDAVMSQSL